jgi:hypothetical protein
MVGGWGTKGQIKKGLGAIGAWGPEPIHQSNQIIKSNHLMQLLNMLLKKSFILTYGCKKSLKNEVYGFCCKFARCGASHGDILELFHSCIYFFFVQENQTCLFVLAETGNT